MYNLIDETTFDWKKDYKCSIGNTEFEDRVVARYLHNETA
jgi:hypothetical protein